MSYIQSYQYSSINPICCLPGATAATAEEGIAAGALAAAGAGTGAKTEPRALGGPTAAARAAAAAAAAPGDPTTAAGAAGALAGTGAAASAAGAGAQQGISAAAGALAASLAAQPGAPGAPSAAGTGIIAMMMPSISSIAGAGPLQTGQSLRGGASGGLLQGSLMSPQQWGPSTGAGCTL